MADALTLTDRLPSTLQALRTGTVDQATARAIAEETALVHDPETLRTVEGAALDRACNGHATARSVRLSARRHVLRADPAAAARRAAAALSDIGVDKGNLVDGVGDLSVTLTAVDRAAVWDSLNDHASALRQVPGEHRTMSQLRAAALVDLTTRPWLFTHPDSGTANVGSGAASVVDPTRDRTGRPLRLHRCGCGRRPSGPWKVDVVVDLATLLGADDDPAVLVGQGLIPAEAARALAADGTWRRLVTDPLTGTVIERSTSRYRPPTSLIDHVTARDQHCRMPGCRRPAATSDVDHREPHSRGGTTSAGNLWALCRHHHRTKHSPGWTLSPTPDGGSSVTTPTGHTYTAPPPTPWD